MWRMQRLARYTEKSVKLLDLNASGGQADWPSFSVSRRKRFWRAA
jgi:hypothetical protein